MAKIFSVIFKNQESKVKNTSQLKKVEDWLKKEYDELELKVIANETSNIFIIGNYQEANIKLDNGILGFANSEKWKDSDIIPDGNFFIYRKNNNVLQLISDASLSRSIYYYLTDDYFVYSSLQIPIIVFKNTFVFEKENTPWFLTSGIHKPFHSFDERIKILKPQNILSFNLNTFEYVIEKYNIEIANTGDSFKDLLGIIKSSFLDTFPKDKKAILLSGGIDSRLLLNLIDEKTDLAAITWTKQLNEDSSTDLSIAKEIAKKYNLEHEIIHLKNADFNTAFELFLKYSEGRIDMISGYLDGFEAWKFIKNMKLSALFRGDETFSLYNGDNFSLVRHRNGLLGFDDIETSINKYLIDKNVDFSIVNQHSEETLNSYAKRIRIDYRLPAILGILNEIKCNFVEVYNPLLNNSIVAYSKQLNPDIDYRDKYFKKFNKEYSNIKYASKVSIERVDDFLIKYKKEIVERFEHLNSDVFTKIGFDNEIILQLTNRLSKNSITKKSKWSILKSLLPKKIKKKFLKLKKHQLSDVRIAFRILILAETFVKIEKALHEN